MWQMEQEMGYEYSPSQNSGPSTYLHHILSVLTYPSISPCIKLISQAMEPEHPNLVCESSHSKTSGMDSLLLMYQRLHYIKVISHKTSLKGDAIECGLQTASLHREKI